MSYTSIDDGQYEASKVARGVANDSSITLGFKLIFPVQNGHQFADDIFKCIFIDEDICISIWLSLKFVPRVELTIVQHWFK